MADANLILHCGARKVERAELDLIEAPPPTETWFPAKHSEILDTVSGRLVDAGYEIKTSHYGVSHDNHRFFATLQLANQLVEGVALAVGIRNSTDKSFPIGFCAGEKVFVCDNLSFGSSTVIAHKHTRNGQLRFRERLSDVVLGLCEYRRQSADRIVKLQATELSNDKANSLMLQAFEQGVVNTRLLPKVIDEYREPQHEEFRPRTVWSLTNAITECLKERQSNPAAFAAATIKLYGLLDSSPQFALAT